MTTGGTHENRQYVDALAGTAEEQQATPDIVRLGISNTSVVYTDKGVVVVDISPKGKAEKAGLMVGDLIEEIDHIEITSTKDYQSVMDKAKPGEIMQFFVRRINIGVKVIRIER